MNLSILSLTISSLKKLFLVYIIFLLFMSIFRVIFFIYYNELDSFTNFNFDMLNMLFLGFRLDLTVIGYIQVIPSFCLIFSYYLNSERVFYLFNKFLVYYLFIIFVIVSLLFVADFGFYSYFKDRLNILFFGLFEDDTVALLKTFWENYNVILILGVFFIYLVILFYIIKKIFQKDFTNQNFLKFIKIPVVFFLALLAFNFFIIRGTFGMYPLGKMIPNISQSEYINKMSQNSVRAFISANSVRNKFKKNKIDYIKETGFENNIERAFEIHKGTTNIDRENLLNNITYTTKKVDDEDYNIVVIMVESFGIPILKYQSEEFDIMGNLKKHFEEDILFSNIISEGDGTISSLEALFLNIPYRPNSFPFSQSKFAQTSFAFSPAFLYTNAGFNTSFIYGGDLTWRDLGKFVKFQSYDSVEGKQDVFASIKVTKEESEYFHPWGIYDEYLYEHILNKLETSNKKEMILALSTNNHPPYDIPKNYETKIKSYSEDLKNHIIGDFDLAKQRFKSYGYALDSVGTFLDKFKKSKFKDNTIVVITADNNTIEGIMKYDDNPIFTSKNIPIYFYLPKKLKDRLEIDTSVAGSQKDIFPTLYNLTLKDTKYLSIGNNLFDKIYPHFGFNGSMIVNHGNEVRKLNSLKEKSEDELVNYYKASLAVTEYLIKRYDNKGNK
ncbi:sulfatase-like hydrolase/transferase [Aliarcobacter cryaerophilus]|uniref:Sulfatase-like hydrolase/transferase n=1 Tax=Aliarcobacter cryaerophilus TaxID=28198 RepID=A0A7G9LPY2_9BACT|nr:alkaline phosphatase family protein [Aliarcobacter cryaerophilus]MCT7493199.1 sulfatase-like hydrolase/transferase [Aliarcobacter cryaerophilus]QNM90681.1 sulfatase-like hydrolase/transferase [Aliarcobacter cryaerophilus]